MVSNYCYIVIFRKINAWNKSEELRNLIVEAKQRGWTNRDVAEWYHVDQYTVGRLWSRWKEFKTVKHKKINGRPRKTTPGQNRLHKFDTI